jgi:dTDP-4-amino-4,6-dideoxygalactose transaminase
MENIDLFYPTLLREDWLHELGKIFETRWIGQGPKVDEFEVEFGKKFNFKYPLAVNSGSASLELAYHLLGLGKGDEVLTPVFTCTATNIPLLRRGVNIRFLDVNEKLVVDYEDVLRKISDKTKAIVVVNLGGVTIDKEVYEIAKHYNVPVVVDACQSLGIPEPNGDYVCYSFQGIKHFTTGDGGMLIVRNEEEYKRAKKLRWFGIDREAKKRVNWSNLVNHQMAMDIEEPGYKFHMNDIAATMGLVGLKHSNELLEKRIELAQIYRDNLNCKKVCGGSYWLFGILTDKRDELIEHFRSKSIGCDIVQIRNDVFKVFGGQRQDLENMNRLEDKYVYIPMHSSLSEEDVYRVVEVYNEWKDKLN